MFGTQVIPCPTLTSELYDERYDVWTKDFRIGVVLDCALVLFQAISE
jgi:hypothetical protein